MARETSAKVPSTEQRPPKPDGDLRRSPGKRASRPKGVDRQEIEWRFDAPDLAAVEARFVGRGATPDGGTSVSVAAEGETRDLSDAYYDTDDWRIYRAGYALRVREGESPAAGVEITFKSLAPEDGGEGEFRRREVTETHKGPPAGAIEVLRGSRGPAGKLFRTFAGSRQARLVLALRTRRRTFDLLLHEAPEDAGGDIIVDASGDIHERDAADATAAAAADSVSGTEAEEITVDASGDIRERDAADTSPGPEPGGITVDASGDIREDGTAEEAEEPADGGAAEATGGIVADASGDIREREPSDEPSEDPSDEPPDESADGRVVGEVALDETEIRLGEGEALARLSCVEVEVGAEEPEEVQEVLGAFAGEMREALGLKPARLSKYAAGLFATGQSPEAEADLGSTRVDDSLTLGELAFAVLRRQFGKLRAHEPGVRVGEDPEELHDMRVATRRMRAAIKLFKKALPERARHLRGELTWVANALGDVRDLDVQLERLEGWSARADDEAYQDALRRAARSLEKRREEARGRMLEVLDSARYERFERSFTQMLKLGPTSSGLTPGAAPEEDSAADEPAAAAGRGHLSRRYRKWRKRADGIDEDSAPEEYHELRKEGKRLRYALEFFADVYGEDVTDGLVKPLKTIQDDLGLHQDDIVAARWLRELVTGRHRFPSKAAFYIGMLVGECLREAAGIRAGMSDNKAFRAVAGGKEWKSFEKAISKKKSKKKK